jgi:glucose/arabinose dehydrogenase
VPQQLTIANLFFVLFLITILVLLSSESIKYIDYASAQKSVNKKEEPMTSDSNLKVDLVANGLELPTGMAFLGPNDILVIEKEKGTVQRIIDGKMLPEPLLNVNVAKVSERGLLGIAVSKHENGPTYVFLFYTETLAKDGGNPVGNRLYRYELMNNNTLVNPKLLLDLPTTPGPSHNGGVVRIGPDNNVYVVVGDINYIRNKSAYTLAQNAVDGPPADGRGGVLRVTQDGGVVVGGGSSIGLLGNEDPLNKYYAYGIRNSFGIGFDPVTGNLWETENGSNHGDEINLVEPGFNGGWKELIGMASDYKGFDPNNDLVDFGGKGKYSDPEFEWVDTVAPTAITFLNSDKLGMEYENDIFVGSVKGGRIFNFDLNDDRTQLVLDNPLDDKVADTNDELEDVTFANDLGTITDIEVGPADGYLYVVSFGNGAIYRIVPGGDSNGTNGVSIPEEEDEEEED